MSLDQYSIVRALLRGRVRLLAYIWTIVHDEHLAEDIYQELSELVLRKQDQFNDETHMLKWLQRAARFRALKALRKQNAEPMLLSDETLDRLESHWRSADRSDPSLPIDALCHCLGQLSPYARRIITFRYVHNLTGETLAEKLRKSKNTVYVAMSRIHRTLAQCIRRYEITQSR